MKKFTRIISLLLVLVMLFSVATACTESNQPPQGTNGDANTDTLNPSDTGASSDGTGTGVPIASDVESGSADATDETQSDTSTPSVESEVSTDKDVDFITIFANGEYPAKIIRSEKPSDLDKDIYTEIRDMFKRRVMVQPALATDFVAYGKEQYDGPAVLVGETNYPESQAVYKKLKDGEASATFVGNKYVIAYTSSYAAEKLLEAFKDNLNKKGTKKEIKIDSAWDIKTKVEYVTSGNETFDANGLISSATLPNLGTEYNKDIGQGSRLFHRDNATLNTFNEICSSLESAKFKKYTTNSIGNNKFATYVTQTQIVHVMFFPNKSQVRTAVDKRGTGNKGFTLPGLSGDNKYYPCEESLMTLVEIENASWPGGMCIIFKLSDGRFVIIDSGVGGRNNDGSSSGWVYATLAKHASDPKNIQVAAWFITHIHSDHAGGLYDMALGWYETSYPIDNEQTKRHNVMPRECKEWIKIDTIIYNSPDKLVDSDREEWMEIIINNFKIQNVIKAHPGQVFYYGNCKITMYGSPDIVKEHSIGNHNDESLSMMVEFNDKKLMILGDAYPKNTTALATIYKESLKADIVQTSHHGYNNTDAQQVYAYVKATMVLWPVGYDEMKKGDLKNEPVNALFKSIPDNMQFAPHGGNIDFNAKWKASAPYRVFNNIPKCDCTFCKANNRTTKSSNW